MQCLKPFNESDPSDIMCDMERRAAHDFHVRRLHRADKRRDSNMSAIFVGNMCALAGLFIAGMKRDAEPESALEAMHKILDFAWMQMHAINTKGGIQ